MSCPRQFPRSDVSGGQNLSLSLISLLCYAGLDDDEFSCPKLLPKGRLSDRLLDSPDPQSPQPPPNQLPATQPAAEMPAKLHRMAFDAEQTTLQHHMRGEGAKDTSAGRLSACPSANPHQSVPCSRLKPKKPRRSKSTLSLGEPRMTRSRIRQQKQSAECTTTPPRQTRREHRTICSSNLLTAFLSPCRHRRICSTP